MKYLKYALRALISFFVITFIIWIFVFNWSFIFKKRIIGEVATIEKVNAGFVVATNQAGVPPQAFSFSIAIKDLNTSEIHMASSEDRKWAAVQPGNCVIAAFYPNPPWMINKGTSDYNAHLVQNFQSCEFVNKTPNWWDNIKFFFLWI